MKGRLGMLAGAISLISVGTLLAQQPAAKSSQPAAQSASAPQAQAPAKTQAAAKQAPVKAATAAPKWSKDEIKGAQEALIRAKVFKGPANGMMGPATRRAIREFQRQHQLKVNGELSDSLLTMLKATP